MKSRRPSRRGPPLVRGLVRTVWALAAVASALAVLGIPSGEPRPPPDSASVHAFFAPLVGNALIVRGAQVLAIVWLAYLTVSILTAAAGGRIVTRLGPIETDVTPPVRELTEERDALRASLSQAEDRIEALEAALTRTSSPSACP